MTLFQSLFFVTMGMVLLFTVTSHCYSRLLRYAVGLCGHAEISDCLRVKFRLIGSHESLQQMQLIDSRHCSSYRSNSKTTTFAIFAQTGTYGFSCKKLRRKWTQVSTLKRGYSVVSEARQSSTVGKFSMLV